MASLDRPATVRSAAAGRWLAGFAVWTALTILSVLQSAVVYRQMGERVRWPPLIIDRAGDWYTCALFTPLFFVLVRRFPLERYGRWAANLLVHTVAVVAAVLLKYPLYLAFLSLLHVPRAGSLQAAYTRSFITESMAFGAMLAVIYGIEMQGRVRQRELQAARLEEQLARARLEALTATLQPHFLFNTLHAVSTLMHRDVEAADEMIARLSDLLRRSLGDGDPQVTVAEEMDLVRCYLSIMEVRFGDRLTSEIRVTPTAQGALVPRLILQPLVENAVRHGIARKPGPGRITVEAAAAGDRLRLTVSDDGPGSAQEGSGPGREGIGLSNTRQRLQEMFGADARLRLESDPGAGLRVHLEVPLQHATTREGA